MKILIKGIVAFAIAFFLLIPLSYGINTVMTEINTAADSITSTHINVSLEVSNNTGFFLDSFRILYSIWGISFFIFILIAAFFGNKEEEYYG